MLQMVYILLYMHNKDIIHHDLTPENIFLTRTMKGE
jgi:serine/threonine protein kinase